MSNRINTINYFIEEMSLEDIKDQVNSIIKKILSITQKHPKKYIQTIFDNNSNLRKKNTDSDSTSDYSSEEENDEKLNNLDKYNIYEFIDYCVEALQIDEHICILSLMYLDKFLSNNYLVLNIKNVHKVMYICFMESQKFFNDIILKNKDYAQICGISTQEINKLEYEFLTALDFNMNITNEDYQKYKRKFQNSWFNNI